MIRYAVTVGDLHAAIEGEKPGWLDKAAKRTELLVTDNRFHEDTVDNYPKPSWSDIKGAWRTLQGDKCAYCEKLVGTEYASVEHDVEHYRPKKKSTGWYRNSKPPKPALRVATTKGRGDGYFWLAYAPLNYCTSCKTCNSTLKRTRFPILGTVGSPGDDVPTLMATERPLLPYPIGDIDDDPEEIIQWEGMVPKHTGSTPERRVRGKGTIAFFDLAGRTDLLRGRAVALSLIWRKLEVELDATRPASERDTAREWVDTYVASPKRPHVACLRSFVRLARSNDARARELMAAIDAFLLSVV